jgi:tetratricopeptide (TPR) repeat protein
MAMLIWFNGLSMIPPHSGGVMRFVIGAILLLVIATSAVASPATAPTSAPASQPTADISGILQQLKNGDAAALLPRLRDTTQSFPKNAKSLSDDQVVLLHALGVCYMKTGDAQKAHEPIEQAIASGRANKSLLVNRAKIDLQAPGLVMRAVETLDRVLTAYGVDEPTLDLFGYGIDTAASRPATATEARRFFDKYTAYNTKLEATRPGHHHWGSEWLNNKKYEAAVHPARLRREQEYAQKNLDEAARNLKNAQARYDTARRNATMHQSDEHYRSEMEDAQRQAEIYSNEVERYRSELEKLNAKFPKPQWKPNFDPVMPETTLTAVTVPK